MDYLTKKIGSLWILAPGQLRPGFYTRPNLFVNKMITNMNIKVNEYLSGENQLRGGPQPALLSLPLTMEAFESEHRRRTPQAKRSGIREAQSQMPNGLKTIIFIILFTLFNVKSVFASELANQFTVSLWVYPQTSVVSKALAVKNTEIRLYTDASGYANCAIYTTSWQTGAVGTTALPLNTWSHVSCTYDKANIKIFVNGIQQNSVAQTAAVNDAATNWRVGSDEGATYGDLTGIIDDFKIYNYARTSAQIQEDMSERTKQPIGAWKFDEGYGITANNSGNGGSALNGTLTSMASPATATSGWTNSGKFNKGINFDGSNDAVNIGDKSTLSFGVSGNFSTSGWVNPLATTVYIMGEGDANDGWWWQFNASRFLFKILDSTNTNSAAITTTTTYSTGQWYYITSTVDYATNSMKVYVNGNQVGSATLSSVTNVDTALGFAIGQRNITGASYFQGGIDEVKIYNYALTSDEVKTDYNHGAALALGALGNNTTYASNANNQTYCIPGDATSCVAPVGEWNFEEGSGASAFDSSGNGNTGTLGGGTAGYVPLWSSGRIGKDLRLDGVDDFVRVTDNTILNPDYITIEYWYYHDSDQASEKSVIEKRASSSNGYSITFRDDLANNPIEFDVVTTSGIKNISYNNPGFAKWNHVAATYDGTNLNLYLNGIATTPVAWTGTIVDSSLNLTFGRADTVARPFLGQLDQVRIFNYARTPAQVAWDYNRGGPVARYKFDECQGATAYDLSGKGNNGTITIGASGTQTSVGNCSTSATTAWYSGRTGKYNSSLNFDGTDDVVTVANTIANAGTVSFWVYPTSSTASMMQLTASANITASSGTLSATGFTSPTIYVNGRSGGSLTASAWNHIVVTTATGISANAIKFGLVGSTYLAGQIDDARIYNYALTGTQIKTLYNENGAVRFGPLTGSP